MHEKAVLYFDRNVCDGEPGCGFVIYEKDHCGNEGEMVASGYQYLNFAATIHENEYHGLINGLKAARKAGVQHIDVKGDSEVVIDQVTGECNVRSARLTPLYNRADDLLDCFLSDVELECIDGQDNEAIDFVDKAIEEQPGGPQNWYRSGRTHERAVLYFDGNNCAAESTAGCGFAIYETDHYGYEREMIARGFEFLDFAATVHESEYHGLINGLKAARKAGVQHLDVKGDSKVVIDQVTGECNVRSARLTPLYNRADDLLDCFLSDVELECIDRQDNEATDFVDRAIEKQPGGPQNWYLYHDY